MKEKSKTKKDRPLRNATITENAFIDLVRSAMEVYKKETFGVLLGTKHKKHYHVTDAIAFQSAKRDYTAVNVTAQRINRMNFALKHLTLKKVIGDYHSHPDGPDQLSDTDVEDLVRLEPTLTCLVSVWKKNKCEKWTVCDDLSMCGTIGGKFFVRITAYETDHKRKTVKRIKIVCPYLKKLNKLKLHKSPMC